jgi:hypothetical protein
MSACNSTDHSFTQCPVCPLIAANVNLCDVLLKWNGKQKGHGMGFGLHAEKGVLEAYDTPEIRTAVRDLVQLTFEGFDLIKKQKIGEDADFAKPSHEFYFKRLTKRAWRFCFHTKTEEKEEEDPC